MFRGSKSIRENLQILQGLGVLLTRSQPGGSSRSSRPRLKLDSSATPFAFIDVEFDTQYCSEGELYGRHAPRIADARLPAIGKAFLLEEGLEVVNPSAEGRDES